MSQSDSRFYEFGPFRIDAEKRVLQREGKVVPLKPKAFDTLLILVRNRGEVLEKDRLLELVWPDSIVEEANLPQNISALRKALGESPSERRYILTVPGRGYRFAAEVREIDDELPDLIVEKQTTSRLIIEEQSNEEATIGGLALQSAVSPRRLRFGLTILLVAGLLAAALSGLYFGLLKKPDGASRTHALRSLAVLPFKTLSGESDEFLGIGMADTLITRLSDLKEVQVRPTSSVLRLSNEGKPPVEIGQRLGVDSVLEGSIRRIGDRIRVTVQLVKVQDGASLWAEKFDENFTDIFTVEDSISAQVAESLTAQLTATQRAAMAKRYTENIEAYQLYLKGQYHINKSKPDSIRKGIEHFHQAIEKDQNYALAYAGMSRAYALLPITGDAPPGEALPKARDAARKALEIGDTLAEAHMSLANLAFWMWDLAESERASRRAIDLNPNNALAHFYYAHLLSNTGRHSEAISEARRASELDPLSLVINSLSGLFLYQAGRYEEAVEQIEKALEIDANYWVAHAQLGKVYVQKKMYHEAIAELQKARELSGDNTETLSLMGHALAASGNKDQARKLLDEIKKLSKQKYVPPYNIAMIYAGLGEKERVFEMLEKAYEDWDVRMVFLKIEPKWDVYRTDPRFASLLERVGLAP